MELQEVLFELLESRFTKRSELVKELSEVLQVSHDSVYRRLRNETLLTPNDLSTLCKRYKISLDSLIHQDTGTVFFDFSAFTNPIQSVDQFLTGLMYQVDHIARIPNGKVYYASSEIPVFYYAFFPKLLMFKLYVWGQSIWRIPFLQQVPFSFDLFQARIENFSKELLAKYILNDTIELWSLNLADNTLNQILYHCEIGSFKDPNEAVALCDDLDRLMNHVSDMAAAEHKFMPNNPMKTGHFALYHNEMIYTNNTIYFDSPHIRMLFSTFANPNFIVSSDPRICDYKKKWFDLLLSKCSALSGKVEKNRNKFFQSVEHSIDRTRQHLFPFIVK